MLSRRHREFRTTTTRTQPETSPDITPMLYNIQQRENPRLIKIERDQPFDGIPRSSHPVRGAEQDLVRRINRDTTRDESAITKLGRRVIVKRFKIEERLQSKTSSGDMTATVRSEAVSENTMSAYKRRGLVAPRFMRNTLGRRAVDAFIHRFEKVENVNAALACAQDVQREHNIQVSLFCMVISCLAGSMLLIY